jgi:hypothetical protein
MRVQRAVGAERRIHAGGELRSTNLRVIPKIVSRVIGGALYPDRELLQDAVGRQAARLKLLVRPGPDALGGARVEQIADIEVALQLQMGPVIQRVAKAARYRRGPGLELVERVGVAGAEALRDPVRAHRPPLVVIPLEPDFEQVAERAILRDIAR